MLGGAEPVDGPFPFGGGADPVPQALDITLHMVEFGGVGVDIAVGDRPVETDGPLVDGLDGLVELRQ